MGKRSHSISHEFSSVDAVGRSAQIDKRTEVHPWLAVWCEPHYFPFIAVSLKPKKLGKLAVEISHRVGERDRQYMIKSPIVSSPDGCGFPCASSVHDHYRGIAI